MGETLLIATHPWLSGQPASTLKCYAFRLHNNKTGDFVPTKTFRVLAGKAERALLSHGEAAIRPDESVTRARGRRIQSPRAGFPIELAQACRLQRFCCQAFLPFTRGRELILLL